MCLSKIYIKNENIFVLTYAHNENQCVVDELNVLKV